MSEYKHYNSGNVWGRVGKVEPKESEEKGTPYLAIEVLCPNDMYGNIKTYGRLWGQKKCDEFEAYHKAHPGALYRFQGFFSQYEKNDETFSNYTFFSWQPFTGTEFRAAFILTGQVMRAEKRGDDGFILLYVLREGSGDHKDVQENFEIYTMNPQDVDGIEDGSILKAKGVLRYKEAEDYFGDTPEGKVRPYIIDMKPLGKKKEPF